MASEEGDNTISFSNWDVLLKSDCSAMKQAEPQQPMSGDCNNHNCWDVKAFAEQMVDSGEGDWKSKKVKEATRLQDLTFIGVDDVLCQDKRQDTTKHTWPFDSSPCRMFGNKNHSQSDVVNQNLFATEFNVEDFEIEAFGESMNEDESAAAAAMTEQTIQLSETSFDPVTKTSLIRQDSSICCDTDTRKHSLFRTRTTIDTIVTCETSRKNKAWEPQREESCRNLSIVDFESDLAKQPHVVERRQVRSISPTAGRRSFKRAAPVKHKSFDGSTDMDQSRPQHKCARSDSDHSSIDRDLAKEQAPNRRELNRAMSSEYVARPEQDGVVVVRCGRRRRSREQSSVATETTAQSAPTSASFSPNQSKADSSSAVQDTIQTSDASDDDSTSSTSSSASSIVTMQTSVQNDGTSRLYQSTPRRPDDMRTLLLDKKVIRQGDVENEQNRRFLHRLGYKQILGTSVVEVRKTVENADNMNVEARRREVTKYVAP